MYLVIGIAGISICAYSFICCSSNLQNMLCGIGTGLLTSLTVSVMMGLEANARDKRQRKEFKEILLDDVVYASIHLYANKLIEINEYIIYFCNGIDTFVELYDDFKPYLHFEMVLKDTNIASLSSYQKKKFLDLFDFKSVWFESFISEIETFLRKDSLLIKKIIDQNEYKNLDSNSLYADYLELSKQIKECKDDEFFDSEFSIKFLKLSMYLSARIIASFESSLKEIKKIEKNIRRRIDEEYFDIVVRQSDDYILSQIQKMEDEEEYRASHPEKFCTSKFDFEDYGSH